MKIYFRVRLCDYFSGFCSLCIVLSIILLFLILNLSFVPPIVSVAWTQTGRVRLARDENLTTIDQYCIVKNHIYVTFNMRDTFICNNMNIMWNIFAVYVRCAAWIRKLSDSIRYWQFQVDLYEHKYHADLNMQTQVQRPNQGTTYFE